MHNGLDLDEQHALIDAILNRAAEHAGDITAQVYEAFYARYPEAQTLFAQHDPVNPERLEGTMIEQAIYSLMGWLENPSEIEIMMVSSLPHHIDTLGVSEDLFQALFDVICKTVASTIPADAEDERVAWGRLQADLHKAISYGASFAQRKPALSSHELPF